MNAIICRWAVAMVLMLSACGGVPLRNQLAAGAELIAGHSNRVSVLYRAGVMTREEATARLDQLEKAGKDLTLAKQFLAVCEVRNLTTCLDAENRTRAIGAILDELDAYLLAKEGKRI